MTDIHHDREATETDGKTRAKADADADAAAEVPPTYPDPDDPRKPDLPTDLDKKSWLGVIKRTVLEFKDDNCTDWAAALTYYAVLGLFPALIALVSVVRLVANPQRTTDALLGIVKEIAPASTVQAVEGPIRQVVQQQQHQAGVLLVVGVLGALWSASAYVSAFTRVSNVIYEVEEGRPIWKLRPLQILVTLACVVLIAFVALALVVTGPLAKAIGDSIGVGDAAVTAWDWLKWPVMAIVVSSIFSLLYYVAPNVRQPKFKWFTLGGLVALVIWVIASAGFGLYVSHFGSYNKTYGSLGAVVVFLVWLWISNIAVLFGAEFNAELERGRQLQAGITEAEETIQLPPRNPAS
jgi:membrane protein